MPSQMLECVICLRENLAPQVLLCSHSFCQECISCWLTVSNKCPLCVRTVSDTSPEFKCEEEEIISAVDFQGNLNYLQGRVADVSRRVMGKVISSQNLKSNVSRIDAEKYQEELRETEELFDILMMKTGVSSDNNSQEVVQTIETLNFKLLELENMLERGISYYKRDNEQQQNKEQEEEDDFENIEEAMEKTQKKSRAQNNKNKVRKSQK